MKFRCGAEGDCARLIGIDRSKVDWRSTHFGTEVWLQEALLISADYRCDKLMDYSTLGSIIVF